MRISARPYAAYQKTTSPGLVAIPAHWAALRNKHVAKINPSKSEASSSLVGDPGVVFLPMERVGTDGRIDIREIRPASSLWNGFTYFRKHDVIVAKITPCFENGKGACLDDLPTPFGFGSTEFIVLRSSDRILPQFLYRLTTHPEFRFRGADSMTGSAGQQRVSPSFVGNYVVPVPPLDEQAAIVRFLDHVDRKIRRFIQAKRRLIELLNEQKQAIIHQAVTRGLNPNAPLKPSGVDWLGDIPEHWVVRRLRTLIHRIDQGVSPQAEARLADEQSWGVLKAGCVNHGVFRPTEHKRLPANFEIDPKIVVNTGDVLVSRASGSPHLVGSVARVTKNHYNMILSDKTFRLVFKDSDLANFLVAAMNATYYRSQVRLAISGAEGLANNLPLSSLRDFLFLVPPTHEASLIHQSLDVELCQIQQALEGAEREITLLREYRTRLIADVVTGKLDVREAAGRLASEPEPDDIDADADPLDFEDAEEPTDDASDPLSPLADEE